MEEEYFRKRPGTTSVGKEYEDTFVAAMALQLVVDDTIENFQLSSNDGNFGLFDDVVMKVETVYGKKQNYALQLKHTMHSRILTKSNLNAQQGDFSIKKYFDDFQKLTTDFRNNFKWVLFTNRKFDTDSDHLDVKLEYNNNSCDVRTMRYGQEENSVINIERGFCYKFYTDNPPEEFQDFLNNFLLYTNQPDFDQLKEETSNSFQRRFSCQKSVFIDYLHFITEWSHREGKKEKLSKSLIKQAITIRLLSPFIQPISASGSHNEPNPQARLLRQAISKFNITTCRKMILDEINKIWAAVRQGFANQSFNTIKKIGIKFQVIAKNVIQIHGLTDEECCKLMWLMNICPLIVKNDKSIVKAINSLGVKNCVVVGNETLSEDIISDSIFQKLSDLKTEEDLYARILKTFKCSLQQKPKTSLEELIQNNDEIESTVTTNELLLMLDDSFTIGEGEILPAAHIQRLLTRHIIDHEFLEAASKKTMVIICFEGQTEPPNSRCRVKYVENHKEIDEFKESEGENQQTIYVTRGKCSQRIFNAICQQIPHKTNYHQFTMLNNNSLEWVRSKNINDLQEFRLEDDFIEQKQLCNYEDDNNTNIVCANPGMGKSTLMKYIKNNSSSTLWTILIYPKDHSIYFRENGSDISTFMEYILNETRKLCKNSFELNVLEALFQKNRISFIWDGLDEIREPANLETVLTIINELSNRKVRQWITARNNFKTMLENRFNVLSRTIESFDETEQRVYIKNRLNCSEDDLSIIFRKIKRNVRLFKNSNVVETPRQIYKLTEKLLENSQDPNVIDNFFNEFTNQIDDTLKHSFENSTPR